ncbi:conserved domain protein [Yersinia pestis KIM D27]|nr:conserved domain protein [Yersinia pestis KIM D27]
MKALLKTFTTCMLVGGLISQSTFAEPTKPLVIQSQGSFAAGGAVITTPGQFDPKNHWTQQVKHIMVITPLCFTRSLRTHTNIPL